MAEAHATTIREEGKKRQDPMWVFSECLGSSQAKGVERRGDSHSTTSSRFDSSVRTGEYKMHVSIEKVNFPFSAFKK